MFYKVVIKRQNDSKKHFITLSDKELCEACKAGSVDKVTEWLRLGADVNRFGLVCSMLMLIINWKYNIHKLVLILKHEATKMFKSYLNA